VWEKVASTDPIQGTGYPLLLAAWGGLAGWSDVSARTLSLFFGVLAVALVYRIGRKMVNAAAGFYGALFLSVTALFLHYLGEARTFSLLMLSGALLRIDPDRAVATAEECIRLDRTYRKAWSTICVAYAATVRLEAGEVEPGLVLWRDVLRQLHWSGEIFHISLQLPNLAESLAAIDPTAALELTAIAGVIGSYFVFDGLAGYPRLTQTVEELGPDVVQAARVRSEARTYDESMQYVFDSIDNLIAVTTGDR
jgi:hypothetical protein